MGEIFDLTQKGKTPWVQRIKCVLLLAEINVRKHVLQILTKSE